MYISFATLQGYMLEHKACACDLQRKLSPEIKTASKHNLDDKGQKQMLKPCRVTVMLLYKLP